MVKDKIVLSEIDEVYGLGCFDNHLKGSSAAINSISQLVNEGKFDVLTKVGRTLAPNYEGSSLFLSNLSNTITSKKFKRDGVDYVIDVFFLPVSISTSKNNVDSGLTQRVGVKSVLPKGAVKGVKEFFSKNKDPLEFHVLPFLFQRESFLDFGLSFSELHRFFELVADNHCYRSDDTFKNLAIFITNNDMHIDFLNLQGFGRDSRYVVCSRMRRLGEDSDHHFFNLSQDIILGNRDSVTKSKEVSKKLSEIFQESYSQVGEIELTAMVMPPHSFFNLDYQSITSEIVATYNELSVSDDGDIFDKVHISIDRSTNDFIINMNFFSDKSLDSNSINLSYLPHRMFHEDKEIEFILDILKEYLGVKVSVTVVE